MLGSGCGGQNQLSAFCYVHCLSLFLLSKLSLPPPKKYDVTHAHAYYVKMSTSYISIFVFNIAKVLWEIKVTKIRTNKIV